MTDDKSATRRPTLTAFVCLLVVLATYMGAYVCLVIPSPSDDSRTSVDYRYGGKMAKRAFAPLNWIDRRVRPDTWPDNSW
jgi:hypothetical protein